MKKLILLLLALVIPNLASAYTLNSQSFYEGPNAGAPGFLAGSDNDIITIKFYLPPGTANGSYVLSTTQYGAFKTLVQSGGACANNSVATAWTHVFTWSDIYSSYTGHVATIKLQQPGGGAQVTVATIDAALLATQYGHSIASETAKPGGRFRSLEKGPILVTGNGYRPPGPDGHIYVNARGNGQKAHTMEVKVNGATIGTTGVSTGAAGIYQYATLDASTDDLQEGDAWQFLVDGVVVDSGTVSASLVGGDPPPLSVTITTENIDFADTAAATPATPTGSQTNTGDTTMNRPPDPPPTVTPAPIPPRTVVNNSNTTISGTGSGATNQDIYNDVLRANIDAGNSTNGPGLPARVLTDVSKDDMGDFEDIQGKLSSIDTEIENAKSEATSRISSFADKANDLPSGLGSVTGIDFATMHFGSNTVPLTLNLASGAGASFISLIRTAFLYGLTVGWVILCVQTVRHYL